MAMVMENQQPLARMPLVPAPPVPPPPPPPLPQAYKHRCKVCKKGFMCGRALGGHMRAHGVTDDGLSADDALDDDSGPCADGDSSEAGSASTATATATAKRMYALRTNSGRLKNCKVCENCGKEFTSWKTLLDHGRCNYDEEEGDLHSNIGDTDNDGEEGEEPALASGWSKGKRTRRAKVMVVGNGSISEEQILSAPSSEEEDLANFLVMLSSSSATDHHIVIKGDQGSCVVSKDAHMNQLLVPQPISMVPPVPQMKLLAPPQVLPHHVSTVPRGMFECKACKKVFTSHQALGGHRASHKKVKGCFAAKLESNGNDPPQPIVTSTRDKVIVDAIPAMIGTERNRASVNGNVVGDVLNIQTSIDVMATAAPEMAVDEVSAPSIAAPFKKKGKVHECSICHRVFMSGQALGGHKRCHWLTTGAGDTTTTVAKLQPFVTQDHVMHAMCQQLTLGRPMFDTSDTFLDLNVPSNLSVEPASARQPAEQNDSMLSLNTPASMYMHSWASNMNNTATSGHYDAAEATTTEDEADSTSAKRAKISDLRDMNMGGETSPWLQVGIGLPSEVKEKATQA
jgi:hypothetical protein